MRNNRDIHRGLSAAYPLSRQEIADLALSDADEELIASIVDEPQTVSVTRGRGRAVTRSAAFFVAIAAAFGLALAVVHPGGGSVGTPAPAYGAELLLLAKISPHILLQEGWHPVVIESLRSSEGFTDFGSGNDSQATARLRWLGVSSEQAAREVGLHGGTPAGEAAVLGATAQIYTHEPDPDGLFEAVAVWSESDRAFEFRSTVPSVAAFERHLDALQTVSTSEWLAAIGPDLRTYMTGLERAEQ